MKTLQYSAKRWIGGALVCIGTVLPALGPGAAHAGPPKPVINAAVVGFPLHLQVQGSFFTPGSSVLVTADYLPWKTIIHRITPATKAGTISVMLPFALPKCGVETIKVIAYNRPTQILSNAVILHFQHCGPTSQNSVPGADLSRSAARAVSPASPALPIAGPCGTMAKHDVLSASAVTHAINATVDVSGTCFPVNSTARISITDRTRGTVLAHSVALRVGLQGWFQYQAPGARANDKVRVRVGDGRWHKTLNITVQVVIP